jgi:hypothetical protein
MHLTPTLVKDRLNVSEACQAALTQAIAGAETARLGNIRPSIVERLKRTRTPEEQLFDRGVASGRRWAADASTLIDLKAVACSPAQDHTLGGALTRVALRHQTDTSASMGRAVGFWDALLGGIAVAGVAVQAQQPTYLRGFREGAREVWSDVRTEFEP